MLWQYLYMGYYMAHYDLLLFILSELVFVKKIRSIEKKREIAWKEYDQSSKIVDGQKDGLIEQLEIRLQQTTELKPLFAVSWKII